MTQVVRQFYLSLVDKLTYLKTWNNQISVDRASKLETNFIAEFFAENWKNPAL